jgi:hypothetical protein
MTKGWKAATLAFTAGAFVTVVGLPAAYADETVIEKRTQESHSYTVEQPAAPAVVERRTTTVEAVPAPPPAVVEKRTTVETVPAAPVIEKRTTETIHTDE